jgi:hypothetical protein
MVVVPHRGGNSAALQAEAPDECFADGSFLAVPFNTGNMQDILIDI